MDVFKFGGASVNNAEMIKNLALLLRRTGTSNLIVVISAMGKTTNKLEHILQSFIHNRNYMTQLYELKEYFFSEAKELFLDKKHFVFKEIENMITSIKEQITFLGKSPHNFIYDQIVPFGELITTLIVSTYLNEVGITNTLLDARNYIKTDSTFCDAKVDWANTKKLIQKLNNQNKCFVTQGFIGGSADGHSTTLGREGSDYTAAIFAYCLDAKELSIWKDVEGVLNADPRYFKTPTLLKQLSFIEAIELAYYGASIIHPKTIQPLYKKNIPLKVRSFLNTSKCGTIVSNNKKLCPDIPCYILKQNQQLLKIQSKDFSFIVENDISHIFSILHQSQMKVNLLHNSAISLSLCIDDRLGDINNCMSLLESKYKIIHVKDVTLYTVRNYDKCDFEKRIGSITPILRQKKDNVVHVIVDKMSTNL